MEINKLPDRRLYWNTSDEGLFKAMHYGKVMPRDLFEQILRCLQFSSDPDMDTQILQFIEAVDARLKVAYIPGDALCLDELMVKGYHKGLNGK